MRGYFKIMLVISFFLINYELFAQTNKAVGNTLGRSDKANDSVVTVSCDDSTFVISKDGSVQGTGKVTFKTKFSTTWKDSSGVYLGRYNFHEPNSSQVIVFTLFAAGPNPENRNHVDLLIPGSKGWETVVSSNCKISDEEKLSSYLPATSSSEEPKDKKDSVVPQPISRVIRCHGYWSISFLDKAIEQPWLVNNQKRSSSKDYSGLIAGLNAIKSTDAREFPCRTLGSENENLACERCLKNSTAAPIAPRAQGVQ